MRLLKLLGCLCFLLLLVTSSGCCGGCSGDCPTDASGNVCSGGMGDCSTESTSITCVCDQSYKRLTSIKNGCDCEGREAGS